MLLNSLSRDFDHMRSAILAGGSVSLEGLERMIERKRYGAPDDLGNRGRSNNRRRYHSSGNI